MFKHNFKILIRNLLRDKTSFLINLIGLSTGLACAFFIYLWISDELKTDKFHEKDDRLYQTFIQWPRDDGSGYNASPYLPGNLAEALMEEVPDVEYAIDVVQLSWMGKNTISLGKTDIKATPLYSNKYFFQSFSFNLLKGNAEDVLQDENSIVISENLAKRLFGSTEDAFGKTIKMQHESEFTVSGIFENVPKNSSLQFDFVLSTEITKKEYTYIYNWGNQNAYIYALLKNGTDRASVNEKIANFMLSKNNNYERSQILLKPYSDTYLHHAVRDNNPRIMYVRIFTYIAIFILIIACINFMNLSTAKSFRKLKELGIKKTIGAKRKTLIWQYLEGTLLITFLAYIIALGIVIIFLPKFNAITGKELHIHLNTQLFSLFLLMAIITGLVAGSYPALYLSGFSPAEVLKGKLKNVFGEFIARKGLMIFQFVISVVMIVGVLVINKQVHFIQKKNLGYDKENVIYFEREGIASTNLDMFISELEKIPGVTLVSSAASQIIEGGEYSNGLGWEGKTEDQDRSFNYRHINFNMLELLGADIKEGRFFSRKFNDGGPRCILNEAAIEYMGIKDPIGKKIRFWEQEREIIGIVKNIQFESVHGKIGPTIFNIMPEESNFIYAKLESGVELATIDRIHDFYKNNNPGFPLNFNFVNNDYQKLYESEIRVGKLSKYFAVIAIIISCLGLFGLSAFTAQRRTKEIGVRKVHGSTEAGIVYLLTGEFSLLVLASILLALPLSYLITNNWLENFAYRIELKATYFLFAGLVAILISWLTVCMHAVMAARINPAKCLKEE